MSAANTSNQALKDKHIDNMVKSSNEIQQICINAGVIKSAVLASTTAIQETLKRALVANEKQTKRIKKALAETSVVEAIMHGDDDADAIVDADRLLFSDDDQANV